MSSYVHTAGIIPVANLKTDIDTKIPEIMLPVRNGFSAIQKSVFVTSELLLNFIRIIEEKCLFITYLSIQRTAIVAIRTGGQCYMVYIHLGTPRLKFLNGLFHKIIILVFQCRYTMSMI